MTTLPPFSVQYDKVIQAYFKDEIQPMNPSFCFCGTLCDNSSQWADRPLKKHRDYKGYKGEDFVRMEQALFDGISSEMGIKDPINYSGSWLKERPNYEEGVFKGMCLALYELRKIHEEHGQIIHDVPQFTQRKLQKV